jgi:hypothetical protein
MKLLMYRKDQFYMYRKLTGLERKQFVPKQLDDQLNKITSVDVSKFKDWNHFFTASSKQLAELGYKTRERKRILADRDWFKKGLLNTIA